MDNQVFYTPPVVTDPNPTGQNLKSSATPCSLNVVVIPSDDESVDCYDLSGLNNESDIDEYFCQLAIKRKDTNLVVLLLVFLTLEVPGRLELGSHLSENKVVKL